MITFNNGNQKHCFQQLFDPRSSIVKSVFDCRLSGVFKLILTKYCTWPEASYHAKRKAETHKHDNDGLQLLSQNKIRIKPRDQRTL